MRIRKALATVAALTVTAGSLAACNDGNTARSEDSSSSPSAASSSPSEPTSSADTSGGHLDEDSLIEAISTGPVKAGSAHMEMTMSGSMALSAEGDVAYLDSGPEMSMTMNMPQMGGHMELRLVDGLLYMTIPTLTPDGKFLRIDPSDKSNPLTKSFGSLSEQMDPLASVKAMKNAVRDVKFVGAEQVDGVDADHYTVTVDTTKMVKSMKQKPVAGMPDTLTYEMWLDSEDLLRRMQFELSGLTVDMSMSEWGEPVKITAPPAGKVMDASKLGSQAS
jgi:hypothetical protein